MRIEKGTGSFDSNTAAGEVNFQPGGGAPLSKYRELKGGHKAAVVGLCASGVSISIVQIFFILTYFGVSFYEISYYYAFYAAFLPPVFLFCPAFPRSPRNRVPWYDLVLFALTLSCLIYFSAHGYTLFFDSWMFTAPTAPTILGAVLLVLILEATRRSAGNIFFAFCLFFLFFPMLAPYVPAPFVGQGYSFWGTIRLHSMGTDSLLGIPIMVLADLLIGFIIFGVAMTITGGGKFFLDLSLSILGSSRGGPAKVSVLASALFGSLSGSVMSNVLTTGSITIPTMKRIGYPSYYAGAIETCASAGGVLMPPIMGSTAFIMAMFIGVPYLEIAVAAAVPSILYFSSILMQVDAYAAKNTISGLDRSELPSLRRTMKEGWFYVLSFLLLVWIVAHLRLESRAPFIATASLLALTMLRKQTRLRGRSFAEFMEKTARLLAELTTILAGVSLMIGALTMTGVSAAFASEILSIAGKNLYILLLLTAFTSIVLGTGMTITACYIFLALMVAPILVELGLNVLAVHLFILYYGMVSFITPPVAIGAFAASTIAGSPPMKTGLCAMRLGMVKYIIPFFFVLNPAMVLREGSVAEVLVIVVSALCGILLISGSLEGYMWWIGRIGWAGRVAFFASGFFMAIPLKSVSVYGALSSAALLLGFLLHRARLRRATRPDSLKRPERLGEFVSPNSEEETRKSFEL